MHALAESLVDHREPLVAVVSVLDDKDAAEMLRALVPLCDEVVCTSNANPRALPPATLASLTEQLGGPPTRIEPDPHRALALARDLAGPGGSGPRDRLDLPRRRPAAARRRDGPRSRL